nr:MAG TPA: hypothetical protein [Caudoviricetes sp.]
MTFLINLSTHKLFNFLFFPLVPPAPPLPA